MATQGRTPDRTDKEATLVLVTISGALLTIGCAISFIFTFVPGALELEPGMRTAYRVFSVLATLYGLLLWFSSWGVFPFFWIAFLFPVAAIGEAIMNRKKWGSTPMPAETEEQK